MPETEPKSELKYVPEPKLKSVTEKEPKPKLAFLPEPEMERAIN